MAFAKFDLEEMKLVGNQSGGVRAYRIVQEPLEPGTPLPEPKRVQLTENARKLGEELREQLRRQPRPNASEF